MAPASLFDGAGNFFDAVGSFFDSLARVDLVDLAVGMTAFILYLTMRSPVYSSVKAIYFLVSLPAFAVFIGLGMDSLGRHPRARAAVVATLVALFALVTIHIVHIGLARGFRIAV